MTQDTTQLTEFCVYLTLKPGFETAFLEASRANQRGARAEPGNRRFEIYQSTDNSLQFAFIESYDSVESVTAHRETPHFKKWLEIAEPMFAMPRERIPGQTVPAGYRQV